MLQKFYSNFFLKITQPFSNMIKIDDNLDYPPKLYCDLPKTFTGKILYDKSYKKYAKWLECCPTNICPITTKRYYKSQLKI